MSETDRLLANNQEYAASFSGPLPMPPSAGVAVIACMDARLNVYDLLGLGLGEAPVSWPSASGCWAPARSSSSTTPTAAC